MAEIKIREPSIIVSQFNITVRALIVKIEKKSRKEEEIANLDRLRKRIALAKQTSGDFILIEEAAPFFIEYSEKILEPNEAIREKFFMNLNVRDEYLKRKGTVSRQDEFIFTLTDSIRAHYNRATQKEKDEVYIEVKTLFECCVEYKIATSS